MVSKELEKIIMMMDNDMGANEPKKDILQAIDLGLEDAFEGLLSAKKQLRPVMGESRTKIDRSEIKVKPIEIMKDLKKVKESYQVMVDDCPDE